MIKRVIVVRGLLVEIRYDTKQRAIYKRKIVSPEFVELWFHVLDGTWDNELWLRLNDTDQDYLALCVHQSDVHNAKFQRALAISSRHLYDRLKLLEGSIAAGNLNPALKNEFDDIMDRLAASGQMNRISSTSLKKRLERTLAAQAK